MIIRFYITVIQKCLPPLNKIRLLKINKSMSTLVPAVTRKKVRV